MVMFPLPGGLHRSLKFNFWWFLESETTKAGFVPPLTLVLFDSGRDNQLRAKSPAMIVIMSQKTNQTNNNNFRGDVKTHLGTVETTNLDEFVTL